MQLAPPVLEFSGLPPEVVMHVFSFLPANEVTHTVPRVCHLWQALARAFLFVK